MDVGQCVSFKFRKRFIAFAKKWDWDIFMFLYHKMYRIVPRAQVVLTVQHDRHICFMEYGTWFWKVTHCMELGTRNLAIWYMENGTRHWKPRYMIHGKWNSTQEASLYDTWKNGNRHRKPRYMIHGKWNSTQKASLYDTWKMELELDTGS